MRKILFVFGAIALFASCSQNDDLPETPTAKMHEVTFEIKKESFLVESTPLDTKAAMAKDFDFPRYYGTHFLQVLIYNQETGKVYAERFHGGSSFENALIASGGWFTFKLPEGDYFVALAAGRCLDQQKPNTYYISAQDYRSDYFVPYIGTASSITDNRDTYFHSFSMRVDGDQDATSVVLQPMWSELNFELTGHQDIEIPEGAHSVSISLDPYYRGFSLMNKQSANESPNAKGDSILIQMPISDFLVKETIKASKNISALGEATNIKFAFIDQSGSTILEEKSLLEYNFNENARIYNVKGSLKTGNEGGAGNVGFRIELGSFKDGIIEIPLSDTTH